MSALPLILAGPIVRRVEATGCSFWIALSRAAEVTVTLWQNSQIAGNSPGTILGSALAFAASEATALTKIGEHLFVGVVTVPLGKDGRPALTPNAVYAYDVSFTGSFGSSGLKQEGLLRDESTPRSAGIADAAPMYKALGYLENRLPAFAAPAATLERMRVVHASCRKTNGPGLDALAWLDDQIKGSFENTDTRVQQLFLTGDQIYADDLGASLLPMLNVLGQDLMGKAEHLPVGDRTFEATLENFPALRRGKLTRGTAGFSSGEGENHLMTFGEFAAMYLAVWSPRVWRSLASNNDLFVSGPGTAALKEVLTDFESCYGGEADALQKWKEAQEISIDKERDRVDAFRNSVASVARALANVSTYMIFDDHEISDDWNLNKQWRNRVYSKPLGKAIVRNGMMAYGLFQGWGNDPAEFAKSGSPNQKFLTETQKVLGAMPNHNGPLPVGSTNLLDQIVGSTEDDNKKRAKWNYWVPGPRYMVCVLDTRTRRKFKGEGLGPPNLLGDTLKDQVPEGPMTDGRELLLLVSAVPVLAPQLIEQIGAPLFEIIADAQYGWKKAQNKADDPCHPFSAQPGVSAADAESWSADEVARENLLKALAPHGKVIILSGDVHYGLTMRMDYWSGTNTSPIPIVQLTSSPACNSFMSTVEALVRSNAQLQHYQEGVPPELLGWNSAKPFTIPNNTTIGSGRQSRLRRSPALLPTQGWPAGTTVAASNPPNWRWRIQLLVDQRPESDLPDDTPRLPALVGPDLNPNAVTTHVTRYTAIATRHQTTALSDKFFLLRRIVFTPNIGLVNLLHQDGQLAVQHTLLSKSKTTPAKGVANTQHVTLLSPIGEERPALKTD